MTFDAIKKSISEIEKIKAEGRYADALAKVEELLPKFNEDYRLYEELSDIYIYLGKYDNALKAVDFALELNEESATGNYLKGFIKLSLDEIKEAKGYLEKSNKLMPNNSEVLRNLGWSYYQTGENYKGIMILKRASILAPQDKNIIEDLAMALIGTGEIEEGNKYMAIFNKKAGATK